MSWETNPVVKHFKSITHTYGWKCRCGSEFESVAVSLKSIPSCLECNEDMYMMYSINPEGEIWMNKAILLEDDFE